MESSTNQDTNVNVGLRVYRSNDIYPDTPSGSEQAVTSCPFCEADDKFYINKEKGLYDCKVCGVTGNPITFVRELYEHSKERTDDNAYYALAKERGYLKSDTVRKWGLVQSSISGLWLYPGYFGHHHLDKIKNVYIWKEYKGKKRLFSSAGLKQCLFNIQNFDENKSTIYLTEGCWDGMALYEMLSLSKWNNEGTLDYTGNSNSSLLADANVLSVPSVNTFDESWARFFSGKKVIILPHNDHPKKNNRINGKVGQPLGQQMIRRIVGMLMQLDKPPTEVNYMSWSDLTDTYDETLKDGYDIRDMLREGKTHEERIPILLRMFSRVRPIHPRWIDESSDQYKAGKLTLDTIACDDYKTLVDAWRKALVWHKGMEKTLCVMLSCVASTMMEEDQLWARIIAPPSSGKTVLCDALCINRKYVSPQSHIRGFYSGMRPRDEDGKPTKSDYGLIAEIMDKTFVTKDGDTLLRSVNHDQIMAEARDLYDGMSKTHFKNDMGREYKNIRTTWILCGTESLRYLDTSELGERFITVILLDNVTNTLELSMARQSLRSLFKNIRFKNERNGKSPEEIEANEAVQKEEAITNEMQIAKRMTGGYVSYLRSEKVQKQLREVADSMTIEQDEEIIQHAYFVSFMRARPSKKQEEKANKELCTRLSRQFGKLAICLAVVMNKKQVDKEVMNIVKSCALDTAAGTVLDIARMIYDYKRLPEKPIDGLSFDFMKGRLKQKDDRMHELLRYMRRIRVVQIEPVKINGKTRYAYRLTPEVEKVMNIIYSNNK